MTERPKSPERIDPPHVADEQAMYEAWLDYHRATLLMKCDGLSDEQLRERSVSPSSLSLLGLVRHMAEVERNWFRRRMAAPDRPKPAIISPQAPGSGTAAPALSPTTRKFRSQSAQNPPIAWPPA